MLCLSRRIKEFDLERTRIINEVKIGFDKKEKIDKSS